MPTTVGHQQAIQRETGIVEPLRFRPFLRPAPWGGRRLVEHYGKPLPADADAEYFGESWEVSGHSLHVSQVAAGHHRGRSLDDLWAEHKDAWAASENVSQHFPLLVKLLDCRQPCSVQVHPGVAGSAAMSPPQQVKIEAWVVLETFPGAIIYAGLREGVDGNQIRESLASGTIVDCLNSVLPQVGDCFLMTPGIVHAMQGVVLAEFQTTSDATLRLFDWNRTDRDGKPRKLHIEESLAEIDFGRGPVQPVVPRPLLASPLGADSEVLVEIPEFRLSRHRIQSSWMMPGTTAFSIWMAEGGAVSLSVNDLPPTSIREGECLLVPPSDQLTWTLLSDHPAALLQCEIPA